MVDAVCNKCKNPLKECFIEGCTNLEQCGEGTCIEHTFPIMLDSFMDRNDEALRRLGDA